MKTTVLMWLILAFVMSMVLVIFPMGMQYSSIHGQTVKVAQEADADEALIKKLPQMQADAAAYKAWLVKVAGTPRVKGVTPQAYAWDELLSATEVMETAYHVKFSDTRLQGPLPRPTLQPANVGPAPPTPPPTSALPPTPPPAIPIANVAGGAPGATPAPTPVPGFYRAADVSSDPAAAIMDVYAGSFDITGSTRGVIGALQDLARQGAMVRVISGSVCRDDRYGGPDRTLSVAFRLYMLPLEDAQ